jgi:hypothetical protein
MVAKPDYCALLVKAEAALDQLVTGGAVVEFEDQNGERVKYQPANANVLSARVEQLRRLCDANYARYSRPRPIGFLF